MTIVAERLEALLTRIDREIDTGILPACQLAVGLEGEVVAFETRGDATPATRFIMYSATKVLVASAVWQLIAEGSIDVGKRVADFIPEFAPNGKDEVTVEQVLLHTSGFPHAPMNWHVAESRDARLEQFGKWRLNWEPGTRFEYHPTSAHWVLAELIERMDGMDYRDAIHRRVTEPLGLPRILGIPAEQQASPPIAEVVHTGEPVDPDELEKLLGVREMPVTEVTPAALSAMNEPRVRAIGVPGGGGIATAADVARFYQALLHNPGQLWDPIVLADVTGVVRNRFPAPVTNVPANRALGVVVAGSDGFSSMRGGFGKTVSARAFGHDGAGGQIAWADPESGLSVCYLTNGHDANFIRQARRSTAIGSLAGLLTTPI